MKRFLLVCSLLALCASAFAQPTRFQTSPAGFVSLEGGSKSWPLGEYGEARMMFLDGEMKNSVRERI